MRGICALVAVGCGLFCTASAEAVLIRLKPSVTVSAPVVRLGDVADIQDADAEMAARLSAVTLSPAPGVARSLRLEFEAIRGRLVAQGVNVGAIEFSGSSVVTVTVAQEVVVPPKKGAPPPVSEGIQKRLDTLIVAAIGKYLRQAAPQLGNVAISTNLTPEQSALLVACGYAKYQVSGGADPWSGVQIFDLRFVDRQGEPHQLEINCQVTPHPRVLVLKHDVRPGHVLAAEDFAWQQLEPLKAGAAGINRLELAAGQETTRALRAGEPIGTDDLRPIPLIRRGDIVTVLSRRQGITVRMEAKAQGDGSAGQPVTLVSLDGRQKLYARVTGYHEAEVTRSPGSPAAIPGDPPGIKFLSAEPAPTTASQSNTPGR